MLTKTVFMEPLGDNTYADGISDRFGVRRVIALLMNNFGEGEKNKGWPLRRDKSVIQQMVLPANSIVLLHFKRYYCGF